MSVTQTTLLTPPRHLFAAHCHVMLTSSVTAPALRSPLREEGESRQAEASAVLAVSARSGARRRGPAPRGGQFQPPAKAKDGRQEQDMAGAWLRARPHAGWPSWAAGRARGSPARRQAARARRATSLPSEGFLPGRPSRRRRPAGRAVAARAGATPSSPAGCGAAPGANDARDAWSLARGSVPRSSRRKTRAARFRAACAPSGPRPRSATGSAGWPRSAIPSPCPLLASRRNNTCARADVRSPLAHRPTRRALRRRRTRRTRT